MNIIDKFILIGNILILISFGTVALIALWNRVTIDSLERRIKALEEERDGAKI